MATAPKASAKVVPLDDAAKAAPKSTKKLMIIALAAVVLAAGGGGAAWFFMKGSDHAEAEEAKPAKAAKQQPGKPPVFVPMEPFTVNLQSEGIDQYLQVTVTMQVADDTQVELIKQYMPLVRSRILMLLASKKASELNTTEGKEKLQEEIVEAVSKPFTKKGDPLDVSAVLFTSFVIQ
ncbi:flagellar basal body-associated protein FliL [Noviherbaspirillum aridicola]|uniref:Flagellar protein FliL n=1 Tax=Noviherbaspirillum aridicola TaxID=2849687 RepID=A0ABQ4Q642_9BURK|nr:flagellar basal body-associated protein FliL [Noviherbaspirillum aridicola]GIZ52680.1 hypothetical protein NCCP691_26940 [Noviherbaspirillum aridicola]